MTWFPSFNFQGHFLIPILLKRHKDKLVMWLLFVFCFICHGAGYLVGPYFLYYFLDKICSSVSSGTDISWILFLLNRTSNVLIISLLFSIILPFNFSIVGDFLNYIFQPSVTLILMIFLISRTLLLLYDFFPPSTVFLCRCNVISHLLGNISYNSIFSFLLCPA